MSRALIQIAGFSLIVLASGAQAEIISLVGDKDCFGIPGCAVSVPADGTRYVADLGGSLIPLTADYRTAGDPAFTDHFGVLGGFSYVHTYVLSEIPLTAKLFIQIAGIHDTARDIYDVKVDTVSVGQIPVQTEIENDARVVTYSFDVPLNLLDGSNAVSLTGTAGDAYIVNFSELRINAQDAAAPEPGTATLLGLGIAGLWGYGRRRRAA